MASVRQTPSGTWQVRYLDPYRRQRGRNFKRKTDAVRFARSVDIDVERGHWTNPVLGKTRFGQWADEWLRGATHLKPKTRVGYENTLKNHVLPVFVDVPVESIDRAFVRRYIVTLTEKGAGPSTIHSATQIVRSVLDVAVDDGALKENPARNLRLQRSASAEKLFLTPSQVEDLASAIAPPFGTLIRFAAYTGLRAGEIGALRMRRVDLTRGVVEVAESLADIRGKLVFGPTKTYARRHVPMPGFLRDEMEEFLRGRRSDLDALVFTNMGGGPLRHNWFSKARYKPAVVASGLPTTLRFHDLRHTYAAFCINSTADPFAVMRRMGHSSITVTYGTYGHLFPRRDEDITAGLEALRATVERRSA